MNSKDKFHPLWYQTNRPFSKFCKQTLHSEGMSSKAIEAIQIRITNEWNTALNLKKVHTDDVRTDVMKEISLAFYYGAFAAEGYNIFAFSDKLGEMLLNTSASDVPISALKSPYNSYFIQFHAPFSWGKFNISGAYVIDEESLPTIQICLVVDSVEEGAHWMKSAAGYFYIPLKRDSELSLGNSIEIAIKEEIIEKWKHVTKSMPVLTDELHITDVREKRAMRESMDLSSAKISINAAMEYISNCLCYLTSYSDDKETELPVDTPKSLLDKVINPSSEKQKIKNVSQLKSMGYHAITYFGRSLNIDNPNVCNSKHDASKATHWRRGHWRNQKHGVKLSEIKLLWIKPTIVGGKERETDLQRLYKV